MKLDRSLQTQGAKALTETEPEKSEQEEDENGQMGEGSDSFTAGANELAVGHANIVLNLARPPKNLLAHIRMGRPPEEITRALIFCCMAVGDEQLSLSRRQSEAQFIQSLEAVYDGENGALIKDYVDLGKNYKPPFPTHNKGGMFGKIGRAFGGGM